MIQSLPSWSLPNLTKRKLPGTAYTKQIVGDIHQAWRRNVPCLHRQKNPVNEELLEAWRHQQSILIVFLLFSFIFSSETVTADCIWQDDWHWSGVEWIEFL